MTSHNIPMRSPVLPADRPAKSAWGQYMTPPSVADFMARLFSTEMANHVHFLDAGAGKGALTCAFLRTYSEVLCQKTHIDADLYEIDSTFIQELSSNIQKNIDKEHIHLNIINNDFIELSSLDVLKSREIYTHSMLNPPYKKINSESNYSKILKKNNLNSTNIYTAFISIAIKLTKKNGEIVAIIPRSFCNGFYHKTFREFLLSNCTIKHIHLFKSRTNIFSEDRILQENIVILLKKDRDQREVIVSVSTDGSFRDYCQDIIDFSEVIHPDDSNKFIRIPIASSTKERLNVTTPLQALNVEVSTGPVVDFRALEFLHNMPEEGDVPLIYPGHLNGNTEWPKSGFRKPNAIKLCPQTLPTLFPIGFYVAIRRMSSKEEKRRIVAHLINPADFNGYSHLGFENHLNIIHSNRKGMPEALALGIVGYLNSCYANSVFHCFNGHTQVNATDLRSLRYPSKNILTNLGKWMKRNDITSQDEIDPKIKQMVFTSQSEQ